MTARPTRRAVLGALALTPLALAGCATGAPPPAPAPAPTPAPGPVNGADAALAALEDRFGGRLGVRAVDTATGATVSRRADERFLLCSTGKAPTAAAVLRRAEDEPGLLDRRITWGPEQIAGGNSPFGRSRQASGATVAELCDASVTVSDNTAQNLLLELLGGPGAMTAFVRGLGDTVSRFDRFEPELNVTSPGDERDTTTPAAIARDLQLLALPSPALPERARTRLVDLLVANTTGDAQIRAGVPRDWRVGDKTGSGAQGESNDIGVVWPPGRAPLVVAVYTAPADPANTGGKAVIAEATRAAVAALTTAR